MSSKPWPIQSNKKPERRKGKVQLIDATGHYSSMRKNEGNKRKEVGLDQIREIVEMYAAFEPTKESKVFDYQEFGYRRIRVLRPLRMKLHVTEESLQTLRNDKVWIKLSQEQQDAWEVLIAEQLSKVFPYDWAQEFCALAPTVSAEVGKVSKPFIKAFINAFGKRDPDGEIVLDKGGNPLPDPELTDYENVPLTQNVHDYFAREVLPHASDAWIELSNTDEQDGQVGVVGYEINFNRYFYEYEPPRDLIEIDAELKAVEEEIRQILDEVTE